MVKYIIHILLLLVVISCSKKTTEETTAKTYYYDPKIPFGSIDSTGTSVLNVLNLRADATVLDKIKLTWTVPAIYTTLNYKVMIYKKREVSTTFTFPNPAEESSGAEFYLYKSLQANELMDENTVDDNGDPVTNIEQNIYYTYWVYISLDDKHWSSGVRLDVLSKTPSETFEVPEINKFWLNKKWTLGYDQTYIPQSNLYLNSVQSMSTGVPLLNEPKAGTAFGLSGNIMYFADTENNRVIIYKRDGAIECSNLTDPDEQAACLYNYAGAPLTAYNILGQTNTSTNYACGDPLNPLLRNECLTRPTRVTVVGTKLFIADSGNNRIVVYDTLPINGCDANITPGYVLKKECTPNWVIGKAGLFDTLNYPLLTDGQQALDFPTDVAVKDGDLYISDTHNNRIVRINEYSNKSLYNCQTDTWGTPTCRFNSVFGQPDFYSKTTLQDVYNNDNTFVLNTPSKTNINPLYQNYTKRYFSNPTKIIFNKDNLMMVLTNENFKIANEIGGYAILKSRIMVFSPSMYDKLNGSCNSTLANFNSTGCDSSLIVGQEDSEKLFVVPTDTNASYDALSAGLSFVTDFDIKEILNADDESIPSTEILMATNASNNSIYMWDNWSVGTTPGLPANKKILDPNGVANPTTGYLMPDLQNLCSIKIESSQKNIYVSDCYNHGGHVYEVQAYQVPTQ